MKEPNIFEVIDEVQAEVVRRQKFWESRMYKLGGAEQEQALMHIARMQKALELLHVHAGQTQILVSEST